MITEDRKEVIRNHVASAINYSLKWPVALDTKVLTTKEEMEFAVHIGSNFGAFIGKIPQTNIDAVLISQHAQ